MYITVNLDEAKQAVKLLDKTNRSKLNPYIRIKIKDGAVVWGTSDSVSTLECSMETSETDIQKEDFQVNREVFFGLIKKAKGGEQEELKLELKDNVLVFSCGGNVAKLPINREPSKYLDIRAEGKAIHLGFEEVMYALNKVAYAADFTGNDLRFHGVIWNFKEDFIEFAATNGFRLAVSYVDNVTEERDIKFMVPIFSLELLKAIMKEKKCDLKLYYNNKMLFIEMEGVVYGSNLFTGEIVDYEAAIPHGSKTCMFTVDRGEFISSLEFANVLSEDSNGENGIDMQVKDEIEIKTKNQNGTSDITVEADIRGKFETDVVGFYSSNILDVLKRADCDKQVFSIENENTPMVITDEEETDWKAFIMPVRLIGLIN